MKHLLILWVVMLVVSVGCTSTGNQQTVESSVVEPNQEEVTTMPEETLSAELQQAVLEVVGEQQNVSPEQLQITAVEAADWPDACLGIAAPDVFCAQMITPGWAVTVTDGQTIWFYRTDLDAVQVKLADTKAE